MGGNLLPSYVLVIYIQVNRTFIGLMQTCKPQGTMKRCCKVNLIVTTLTIKYYKMDLTTLPLTFIL